MGGFLLASLSQRRPPVSGRWRKRVECGFALPKKTSQWPLLQKAKPVASQENIQKLHVDRRQSTTIGHPSPFSSWFLKGGKPNLETSWLAWNHRGAAETTTWTPQLRVPSIDPSSGRLLPGEAAAPEARRLSAGISSARKNGPQPLAPLFQEPKSGGIGTRQRAPVLGVLIPRFL